MKMLTRQLAYDQSLRIIVSINIILLSEPSHNYSVKIHLLTSSLSNETFGISPNVSITLLFVLEFHEIHNSHRKEFQEMFYFLF